MIHAMRQLALEFLYHELGGTGDPEAWYKDTRANNMGALFPYLIEAARDSLADNYYVLYPDANNADSAILEQRVRKPEDQAKLPFVQSTGSQSPALGPIIKRSYSKAKGGGPSDKILNSTLAAFGQIGLEEQPWSDYFLYAQQLLSRQTVHSKIDGQVYEGKAALHQAIQVIEETRTAFVTILDNEGRLPGEREDYRTYLQGMLAREKYSTQKVPPIEERQDALTGEITTLYPNSLTGAGLNISNVDRLGVFADLDEANAWKKFSMGAANADLLYTFSFHMRDDFIGRVAGELALVLPHLTVEQSKRQRFISKFRAYLEDARQADVKEKRLLRYFKDEPESIVTLTLVWADFGQKLENVTGIVSDVLPSRLSTIASKLVELDNTNSSIFPMQRIETIEPDLAFNGLGTLFKRMGGKKNKNANESARLFEFKRDTAARVYHGQTIATTRFWDEVLAVAKTHLMDIAESGNTYGLTNEGRGKKGAFLTLAGWVKYVAKYIYFFRELEVYPKMTEWNYQPKQASLQGFFADTQRTAGLDNPHKVYAFLLGVLFGKVMEVQAARDVNVGANALTWLKRLNMTGADLPALYNKVREKLLTYGTEKRSEVEAIVSEIGALGIQIGTPNLNKTDACYYLLLGQSLTTTLIPPKPKQEEVTA